MAMAMAMDARSAQPQGPEEEPAKPVSLAIPTPHTSVVHDAQLDLFGTLLATGGSDGGIAIYTRDAGGFSLAKVIPMAHAGPVWKVAWAHPRFGPLLASCGYDRRAVLWLGSGGDWAPLYAYKGYLGSVNVVAFAPQEHGLMFASAGSDGSVTIHKCLSPQVSAASDPRKWNEDRFDAHKLGCSALCWAPAGPHTLAYYQIQRQLQLQLEQPDPHLPHPHPAAPALPDDSGPAQAQARLDGFREPYQVPLLATGGADSQVKIWWYDHGQQRWGVQRQVLAGHKGVVRDVAWAPSLGALRDTLASCDDRGTVIVWTRPRVPVAPAPASSPSGSAAPHADTMATLGPDTPWTSTVLTTDADPPLPAWRLSWSPLGNILAVSAGPDTVQLWEESSDGRWQRVGTLDAQGQLETTAASHSSEGRASTDSPSPSPSPGPGLEVGPEAEPEREPDAGLESGLEAEPVPRWAAPAAGEHRGWGAAAGAHDQGPARADASVPAARRREPWGPSGPGPRTRARYRTVQPSRHGAAARQPGRWR